MLNKLIVSCFIILLLGCGSKEKAYNSYIESSYENFEKKNYKTAYQKANRAIKIDSSKYLGFVLRGRASFELGNDSQAKIDFLRAIELDSKNTIALYYLGLIAYDSNKFDEAINYFDKAIITKGTDSIYFEKNNNFTVYTYEENIRMPQIRFYRGLAYYYNKNNPSAYRDLSFSLNSHTNEGVSCLYLGRILLDYGKQKEACDYWTKANSYGEEEAKNLLDKYCK